MNRRVVVIALLLSVVWMPSKAQVDKQVEVIKAYTPSVESATKLKLEPDMVDTVRLRPEIDYSITPRSINTTLSTRLYNPATVTYWEFNRPKTTYLKAGVGYPWESVADLYVSNSNPNTNYIIGYLNHEGQYSKITNDYDDKVSALNSQNRVGVAAGVVLSERVLEGQIGYDIDFWSRYATSNPALARSTYQTISLEGRYGDEFVDFSKWNFGFDVDARHLFNSNGDTNTAIGAGGVLGGDLGNGILTVALGYDYIAGGGSYQNSSLKIGFGYAFKSGDWSFDLGADYYSDNVSYGDDGGESAKDYFIPQVSVRNASNLHIQPFLEVSGELNRYSYGDLVALNPYVAEGLSLGLNSVEYSLRGGIWGTLSSEKISYSLFADYTTTERALYWSLCEEEVVEGIYDNYYTAVYGSLGETSINANLEYRPIGDLVLKFGGVATKYIIPSSIDVALGRACAELFLGGEYTSNKMRYGVSANLKGVNYTTRNVIAMTTGEVTSESVQVPTTINLRAFVERSIKSDFVIFIEGDNLANSKQYEWMGYREYGVNVMAGVKMQF